GGYLALGFQFAFVVWMYRIGSQYLGWWNPSEILFHPDALAAYFPWLTSISNSLHAGVWEECLFRAVPLAGAALIGERLGTRWGGKKVWVVAAFILQAVIFGAAHASYPTQPSYARLIELLVPSFLFGGFYLAFGLLPGIILHYAYDVSLFSMPLFLSEGRTAWVSRAVVIGVSALPLFWIGLARLRNGKWTGFPEALRNVAWLAPRIQRAAVVNSSVGRPPKISAIQLKRLRWVAILGFVVWVVAGRFLGDTPGLRIQRAEAIALAQKVLVSRGIHLGPEWRALAMVEGEVDEEDRFVWKTSGSELYRELMGSYLSPPQWKIRFVRPEGDVVERADEYQVFLLGSGKFYRFRHDLPEARPGANLNETQARVIAEKVLREQYQLQPSRLKEVSARVFKHPARLDWFFLWEDPAVLLKQGETRVAVRIAGNEPAGHLRMIHVPEDWERRERSIKTAMGVVRMTSGALLGFLILLLSGAAVRGWVRHSFAFGGFVAAFVLLAILGMSSLLNHFPEEVAHFSNEQSFASQYLHWGVKEGVFVFMSALIPAIWIGYLSSRLKRLAGVSLNTPLWVGPAVGLGLAGALACVGRLGQSGSPHWPELKGAATWIPALEGFAAVKGFIVLTAFLMLVWTELEQFVWSSKARGWIWVGVGVALGAFFAQDSLLEWGCVGVGLGACFWILNRFLERTDIRLFVSIVATFQVLLMSHVWFNPGFVGANVATGLGVLGVMALTWGFARNAR
ncbi:CPBP family intramembrane glutamic endopeptidase, partial [Bdellovibrionota bacterium FG-1]